VVLAETYRSGPHRDRTVVVTMGLMRMMQVSGDDVVDVVAVRDGLVTA
jgi:hypothetical protein